MPHRPLTSAGRERVAAALAAGATIEAIRLYRLDTLASLAEAKAGVDAMAAGVAEAPAGPAGPAGDDAAVIAALYAGRKIEAIKQYRLAHRVDLRQAKAAVEATEAELRQATPERFAAPPAGGGCGGLLAAVLLLAAVAAGAAAAWSHLLK